MTRGRSEMRISHLVEKYPPFSLWHILFPGRTRGNVVGGDKFWKPSKAPIYYFKRGPVNWRFTKKLERCCDSYIVLGIYTHG